MGSVLQTIESCFCIKEQPINYGQKITRGILKDSTIDFDKIPDDEFYCPKCGQIPEILNIFPGNNKIELDCKNCEIIDRDITKYFQEVSKLTNTSLQSCTLCDIEIKKNNPLQYCFKCHKDYCIDCFQKFDNKNEHKEDHKNFVYNANEKCQYCPVHYKEQTDEFCFDCEKNICEECSKSEHSGHYIKAYNYSNIQKYVDIINQKIKQLFKIKLFINLLIKRYNEDSQYGKKNVETAVKCIEKENKREQYLIDLAIYQLKMKK